MKVNIISLMRAGAEALEASGDEGGRAYMLHEAANNLLLALEGTETFDEFRRVYVAGNATALDLDRRFPAPIDEDSN